MSESVKVRFAPFGLPSKGVLVIFTDKELRLGTATRGALGGAQGLLKRAAALEHFDGKRGSSLELVAPAGMGISRLIAIGVGKDKEGKAADFVRLGGIAMGKVPRSASAVTVFADLPAGVPKPGETADLALGMRLRGYSFDRYKTKRKDGEEKRAKPAVTIGVRDAAASRTAWARRNALGEGVDIARDLVNEPANILFPTEFARRAATLKKVGVAVSILDTAAMKKLGMNALLGVAQGSAHEARVVVMNWNGGKRGAPPVAFIGKGVTFDTGGVSIKPAGGMEEMKGDMAGAACVVGLMHALAVRKARANVVGAIGLVENMLSGQAQRPGDIVTSMSGQTIEIINTDAEGRLVLADVLWHVKSRFKPKFMVNLATLTGAIIVALGHEFAGLFSNDDTLAKRLIKAGEATGERVWRMPLAPEYDKMIDSKFADMKNVGGRSGSAITAAQFLQRFVDKTPWAHLDIAGTGFSSLQTDTNRSWGSGWGVRLLDRLVADHYET